MVNISLVNRTAQQDQVVYHQDSFESQKNLSLVKSPEGARALPDVHDQDVRQQLLRAHGLLEAASKRTYQIHLSETFGLNRVELLDHLILTVWKGYPRTLVVELVKDLALIAGLGVGQDGKHQQLLYDQILLANFSILCHLFDAVAVFPEVLHQRDQYGAVPISFSDDRKLQVEDLERHNESSLKPHLVGLHP